MATIHAIYENGVFRPTEPVALAESTEVAFEPRVIAVTGNGDLDDSHFISRAKPLTADERKRWMAEMALLSPGDTLPADWTRADIYEEDELR